MMNLNIRKFNKFQKCYFWTWTIYQYFYIMYFISMSLNWIPCIFIITSNVILAFAFCIKTNLCCFQINLSIVVSHCLKLHITLLISKYANINQELQMYLRIWYPISSMSWSHKHHSTWHEAAVDDSRGYICGGMIISFAVLLVLICTIVRKKFYQQ